MSILSTTWMITTTGAQVDLRVMALNTISLLDIAHSLALTNRFTGHTSRPYSVAEHSLLVAEIMQREFGVTSPAAVLAALLHDAHEAYAGDMATPMKQLLGCSWRSEEDRIAMAVLRRFGVADASAVYASIIKRCDLMALAMERRDLLPATSAAWPLLEGIHTPDWLHLQERAAMGWQDWRQAFIDRFASLHFAIHGTHPVLGHADHSKAVA